MPDALIRAASCTRIYVLLKGLSHRFMCNAAQPMSGCWAAAEWMVVSASVCSPRLPVLLLGLLHRLTNSVHCIAIHSAAGPELLTECRTVPEVRPGVRCPTGEARITRRALGLRVLQPDMLASA